MSELANKPKPFVSTNNSSTTLLTNGSTFTGTWEDVADYDSLTLAIATDQDGIYYVEFSPDGTNADSSLTRYYRTSQINAPHRFTVTRRYARIRFTNNSGSDQTYLRLQTIFGDKQPLNVPIDGTVSQDYDATVVRPTDVIDEIALGLRQGVTTWQKFGYNDDVDTASAEVIWATGGAHTILTSASTLTIVSSDVDDDGDPADTGARTIIIYGIDANRESQTEVVTMNGTTNVVTSSTWLGINRVAVASAGSSQANEGNITITATTGGSVQAYIPAGQGVTQQLIYFTPSNARSLVKYLRLVADKDSGGGNPRITFYCYAFSPVSNVKYELFRELVDTDVRSEIDITFSIPLLLTEGDVFWVEAETSANDTEVSGRFSVQEYKNADG